MDCQELYTVYGVANGLSAVYWIPWTGWWVKEVLRSRGYHFFNWVVLAVLVLNTVDDLIEAVYYYNSLQPSLRSAYYCIRAAKKALNCGYLFPVVRGVVSFGTEKAQEWMYPLGSMVCYFCILVAFDYLDPDSTLSAWSESLFRLLVLSLQIHFASATLESSESALLSSEPRRSYFISTRLRRLRWLLVALFIVFVEVVFSVLALMDTRSVVRRCDGVFMGFADVVMVVQQRETVDAEKELMVN